MISEIKQISKVVDWAGYTGPYMLFILSIILLKSRTTFLYAYVYGFLLDQILNLTLKAVIQDPRPSEEINIFNAEKTYFNERIGPNRYGMPSGHAQSVFFSLIFIYLSLGNSYITIFYGLIALCTMYQRVAYRAHDIIQVMVGACVGTLLAWVIYMVAKKIIAGKLKLKPDDNAILVKYNNMK